MTFPRRSLPTPAQHHKKGVADGSCFRLYRVRTSGTPAGPFPQYRGNEPGWCHGQTPRLPSLPKMPGGVSRALTSTGQINAGALVRQPERAEERSFCVGRERCEEPHATGRQHRRHCGCALRGRPLQVESHASSARRGPFDRIRWRNRTSPDPRPGRLMRRHALPAVPNPEPSARLFFVPRSAVP